MGAISDAPCVIGTPGRARAVPFWSSPRTAEGYRPMHILKLIGLTIIQLVKQAWLFPQSVGIAVRHRRQQVVLNELEAERLDRIRNPSKYLGK